MKQCSFSLARLAICALPALLASPGLQAQVVFIPQNTIAVGSKPNAMAIADFEDSGKSDLIVANQGAASLSVLRGLGNGFFQALPNQSTGGSPQAVAVADFNRDGRLDLAVANFSSNNVSIFLGNGNGTFRSFTNLASAGPAAIAVGDFNADGKLDLAVVENTGNRVSIFLGNGLGIFTPFFTAAVGDRPVSIAVADFNGDGKLDLAVANSNSSDVSILLGVGNGTFLSARSFAAGDIPASVALGDFNADGRLDLVVANATGFSTSSVSVLLGLGNGTFLPPRTIPAGSNASFVTVADFNLDGKADLAVANAGSSTISIFLGLGNAAFLPPLDFTVGNAPAWISVADLNADGKPDLVVANSQSNTLSVLINRTVALNHPAITSFGNAASFQSDSVAPGELVTIFGSNLGPNPPAGLQLSASGRVATTLAQTQVLFDGVPSPLIYAAGGQVTAVVPYSLAGQDNTQLTVANNGQESGALTIPVAGSAPGLFTADNSGQGQGAILNQDGTQNTALNPAPPGSVVTLYATGAGQTDPPGVDGLISTDVLPAPLLRVSVTIDGRPAGLEYAGAAPGLVSGVMQINARIPDGVRSGAVSVVLQVGSALSQPGVTLSVQ